MPAKGENEGEKRSVSSVRTRTSFATFPRCPRESPFRSTIPAPSPTSVEAPTFPTRTGSRASTSSVSLPSLRTRRAPRRCSGSEGLGFPTRKELEAHLALRAEAEARDHRVIGARQSGSCLLTRRRDSRSGCRKGWSSCANSRSRDRAPQGGPGTPRYEPRHRSRSPFTRRAGIGNTIEDAVPVRRWTTACSVGNR